MNPNQVRHHDGNICPTFPQLKTDWEQRTIELNLPAIAGSFSWNVSGLAAYVFRAIDYHGEALMAQVVPALTDDYICIGLCESIALARAFFQTPDALGVIPGAKLPGLAGTGNVPIEESLYMACFALNSAAKTVIERMCQDPADAEGNLLLAESFCIAIAVLEQEKVEIERAWKDTLFAFAERSLAAALRSPSLFKPEPRTPAAGDSDQDNANPNCIPVVDFQNP